MHYVLNALIKKGLVKLGSFRFSYIFRVLRQIKHGIKILLNEVAGARPRIPIKRSSQTLVTLGTENGGWTFADEPYLRGSTIISCGAGEDISFDVLFSLKFGARVIIVDPTPRAIMHVNEVIQKLQESALNGTLSSLEIYGIRDFSKVDPDNLVLVERALWKKHGKLKFFPPKNPNHVSHSALDFQNDYRQRGPFIEVEALTYQDLIDKFGIEKMPLLKLDIEGAEIEVLKALSENDILPLQICVEYDELLKPNKVAAERVRQAHDHLSQLGYKAIYKDIPAVNYLYLRDPDFGLDSWAVNSP